MYYIFCDSMVDEKTTIQITEDLRKRLKILSSYEDNSYNEMLEELIRLYELNEKAPKGQICINIPVELNKKIEKMINKTGFTSVSDYTTFLLRMIIMDKEKKGKAWEKGDKEKIMERLRALGYVD